MFCVSWGRDSLPVPWTELLVNLLWPAIAFRADLIALFIMLTAAVPAMLVSWL
jgi:hypothetical protein